MPKKKLTKKELDAQDQKFIAEDEDVVFIKEEKEWKAEVHPEQK